MIPGIVAGNPVSGGGGGPTQSFSFDPSDKNPAVTLSNGNKTASNTGGTANYYVMCTNPKNSGKLLFEFTITSMPPDTGRVMVGMADVPAMGETINGIGANSGFVWFVRKSSALSRFYYNGSTFDALNAATQSFDTGDRVTCTVDFSTKEVKVYRNGTLIYTKTVASIDTGTYTYAPVAKVWGTTTPATATIPSDIMYPVGGFAPWA